jgi:hypothetical protein
MDVLTLIATARDAGLSLDVGDDGRLNIQGPKSAAGLAQALGERKSEVIAALTLERASPPPVHPDIRFHDELASWPIPWREAWGLVTNAIEDASQADGLPAGGSELAAFAEVARLRDDGMTPREALATIWDAWGLPGEPPDLGFKQEWSSPRHEPLDDEEALRQILSIPAGAPWPPLGELIESARQHNAATAPGGGQRGKAIKNHQPMEMTPQLTIMGEIGDEVGCDHPAPLIRPLI